MTSSKNISRITKFLANEFNKHLSKISIFKNEDGSYEFFDKYVIIEKDTRYEISFKNQDSTAAFSSLKNAVAWCIHDNQNKLATANRIKYLDMLLSGTEVSIEMHKKMVKNSKNIENTLIQLAKLNEEKLKKSYMVSEMDGLVQDAKHLQIKNFIRKDK